MIRVSLMTLALALLFVACGGGSAGAGSTPEASFKAMQSCVTNKDWGAFFDMMADSAKDEMKEPYEMIKANPEAAKMFDMDPDAVKDMEMRDFVIAMMTAFAEKEPEDMEKMANAEFISAEEEGDKATVKVKMGDEEEELDFVKVDGKWLIAEFK